jgi:EAL domain-containing protein (putative c-di-GMP-specific phosphodiesterase class I)
VLVLGALAQGAAPPAADPSLAVADSRLQQLLAQAAGPFKRWREASPEQAGQRQLVRLGLALSAAQATRAAWADELQAMLASHGLAPSSLLLELPPTLAYDDRNLRERLAALAALGCELAINRFGTGTATLSALEKLPLALLKIDAGVIEGALSREHHRVLLEAIVRVARSQGMATLAQGVASGRALARVCELGCDRVEGPLPRRSAAPLLQGLALLA